MDLPGPRWKKGKDGKDFAALAAANPMSSIVAELQASLRDSEAVAILAAQTRDAILEVGPRQAALLNRAAFGRAVESAGAEMHWFQLGPEEVFFLCHALKCVTVESEDKAPVGAPELWDLFASTSEPFPEMYKAYEHLRLKNWVVRSGLQYGADFVAYRHHPALVHSEFTVIVVPEGKAFGTRCGRMKVWSELQCALRASGSVAKTLLVLTITTKSRELGSLDCLEQLIVHERAITRWIPQQCREQQDKPRREETNRDGQRQKSCREVSTNEEQEHTSGDVAFSYWGVVLRLLAAAAVRCNRPHKLQGNAVPHGLVPLQTGGPCDPAQRRYSSWATPAAAASSYTDSLFLLDKFMHLPGPRWKKGKDGKDFATLAAANPMSSIVAELQASLRDSEAVAILAAQTRDAILEVGPRQAALLNRAAFGRAVESAGAERQWFQLGPEEVFFLCHALKCVTVESENKAPMSAPELWDLLASTSESFPEMYKAYEHLRLKNWVVRSGLQYGADFVAYRHHPALVHSEFTVIVVPEGKAFGTRCGRMKVWSDLQCALRASGSVAKTLLVLTISTKSCELGSLDCLEQLIVHERTITRWIPQQCREQQDKPCREEINRDGQRQKSCSEVSKNEEQEHTSGGVVFSYWGVVLSFTILSSLLVYKLKF